MRRIRHRSGVSIRRIQLRRHMFRIFFDRHIVREGLLSGKEGRGLAFQAAA